MHTLIVFYPDFGIISITSISATQIPVLTENFIPKIEKNQTL